MKRILILSLLCSFSLFGFTQKNRVALVIGNSNYQKVSVLLNPVNDATDMAKHLTECGFKVYSHNNLNQNQMKKAIDEFGMALHNAAIGVFFYAGHGIQVRGRNYLIPVDAAPYSENDVEYNCVDAGRVLGKMEDAGTSTNIVILDACRENPFERSWSRKSTGNGLAFMNAPEGSLIAYSTAPGQTASDGSSRNSPYTSGLIRYMNTPNLKIEDLFKLVRMSVREETEGIQVPWESTSLEGDFYFNLDSEHPSASIDDLQPEIAQMLSGSEDNDQDILRNEFIKSREELSSGIRSIAILPFANYTGVADQEYLASGIQDALISELGKLGTIRVVSKTSTMFYAGYEKTLDRIASELNVDGIVEASLLKMDEKVRIQLKLFSISPSERLLWSQTFDSDLSDMMNLYGEVIKEIATEIQLTLSSEQETNLENKGKVNPEAYKEYLQGKFQMGFLTQEGIQAAMQHYSRAIEIDPEFASGYAGLASIWIFLKQMDFVSPAEANPYIEKFMAQAIALDYLDEEVLLSNALKQVYTDFDWESGEASFSKCLELNPYNSTVQAYYSHLLMILKRPAEMRMHMQKALDVDPNNFLILALKGIELLVESKNTEGIGLFLQLQKFMPTNPLVILGLFQCYANSGQYDLAVEEICKLFAHLDDQSIIQAFKSEYENSGFEKAMNTLGQVLESEELTFISAQQLVTIYCYADNLEKAMYWLERMYIRGDPDIPYIGVIPIFQKFADNPRYVELMTQLKLPQGDFE